MMEKDEINKIYGRLVLPGWSNNVIENPDTIAWIEGDGNYSKVKFTSGVSKCYTVCLNWFEGRLNPEKFFRIHDSHIVNGKWIKRYTPAGERYLIELEEDGPLYVSRDRRETFEAFIYRYLPDGYKRRKNNSS
jgi:DNA-binding LytR/AlgR family response regulator